MGVDKNLGPLAISTISQGTSYVWGRFSEDEVQFYNAQTPEGTDAPHTSTFLMIDTNRDLKTAEKVFKVADADKGVIDELNKLFKATSGTPIEAVAGAAATYSPLVGGGTALDQTYARLVANVAKVNVVLLKFFNTQSPSLPTVPGDPHISAHLRDGEVVLATYSVQAKDTSNVTWFSTLDANGDKVADAYVISTVHFSSGRPDFIQLIRIDRGALVYLEKAMGKLGKST